MKVFKVNFDYDSPYDTLHSVVLIAEDLEDAKTQVADLASDSYEDNRETLVTSAKYEEITSRGIILKHGA